MDTRSILEALKAERDRLDQAIAALEGAKKHSGRMSSGREVKRGRRRLSAAAKRRISEMMKKRWKERRLNLGTTDPEEGRPPKGRPNRDR
jgi:hypothetical protein